MRKALPESVSRILNQIGIGLDIIEWYRENPLILVGNAQHNYKEFENLSGLFRNGLRGSGLNMK